MNEIESLLFQKLAKEGINFETPTWETCRSWLSEHDWKINVLSDYSGGEVRLAVRNGFERIETKGRSDLEVLARAIVEVQRRSRVAKD